VCKRRFLSKEARQQHMQEQHPKAPHAPKQYLCGKCQFGTNDIAKLQLHARQSHPGTAAAAVVKKKKELPAFQ
jgi:hypothetical protein